MGTDKKTTTKKIYEFVVKLPSKIKDNKNIRLVIILFFVWLLINSLLPYFFPNRDSSFTISKDSEKIEVSVTSLSKELGRFEQEKKSLEQLLTTELIKENKSLRDSVTNLLIQRQKDINTTTDFIVQLKAYSTLSGNEKDTLMSDIFKFLSKEQNPNFYMDFGIRGQEIALTNAQTEIEKIKADNNTLLTDNEKLNIQIKNLKRDTASLSKQKDYAENLFTEAKKQIAILDTAIQKLKEDTLKYSETVSILTKLKSDIEKEKNKLEEDIKKVNPVRVDGLEFKPVGVATRKDGTYKLGSINQKDGLQVKFTLNYNKPVSIQKDTVLLVFNLTNSGGETKQLPPIERIVEIGKETTVTFNDNFDYGTGLYVIQIINKKFSENIPVEHRSFTTRTWYEKVEK